MALTEFEKNMDIIAALDDEPNDVGGLSAAELKAKFDEAGKALQDYINNTLLPALDNAGVERSVLLPLLNAGFKYMRLNSDKVLEVSTDGETWQATGSSGHLVYDKNGEQLPQRSRLKFANGEVTDDGTYTIVKGEPGPAYTAGENISISGSVIATKAFPCNPNLLVNWYFGNPVNQRGQTSYPGGAYAVDRWLPSSGNTSLVVNDGFLTVTTRTNGAAVDQIQEFPYPPGTVLTLSALMRCTTANAGLQCRFGKDGTATDYSETVMLTGTGDWELITLPLTIPSGIGAVLQSPRFRGTAAGITYDIKAIKLELGTQQTLAHQENGVWVLNEIPDYSEQYRRCLRYFQSIQGGNFPIFAGEVGATGRLCFTVPLVEPMRSGVTVADVAASDIYTTAGRAKLIDAPGYGVWAQHLNAVTIWTAKNSVKDYTTDAAIAGAGAVCMATLNLSAELSGA